MSRRRILPYKTIRGTTKMETIKTSKKQNLQGGSFILQIVIPWKSTAWKRKKRSSSKPVDMMSSLFFFGAPAGKTGRRQRSLDETLSKDSPTIYLHLYIQNFHVLSWSWKWFKQLYSCKSLQVMHLWDKSFQVAVFSRWLLHISTILMKSTFHGGILWSK